MKMKFFSTTIQLIAVFSCLLEFSACKKESLMNHANASSNANAKFVIPDSNLVARYKFNGDTKDYSIYHNDVIFNNAKPAPGRNGKDSNGYYFNGYTSYMRVKNSPSLNPTKGITLAAVIRPSGFYQGECHYNRIMQKSFDDFTDGRMELGFSDQPYYNYEGCDAIVSEDHETFYGSYGNGSYAAGASAISDYIKADRWYALVYTFDGTTSNLYINNVLRATSTQPTTFTPNNDDLLIGKTLNPSFPYWFTGIIDGIRIYNVALTEDQVHNLSNNFDSN